MEHSNNSILIIGEGETEFYYFNSLKDLFPQTQLEPSIPKHSNLLELEKRIKEGLATGYSKVFCVIDMDNKIDKELIKYESLKRRYNKVFQYPKRGISCEVNFVETHRCTELFFLYYFKYTTKEFCDQPSLLNELNNCCEYKKEVNFFRRVKGLHSYFERNGGTLKKAIENSRKSCVTACVDQRKYTFSQMARLFDALQEQNQIVL